MIEQHVHWNEEIGDWQLRSVAYTGNNMRKHDQTKDHEDVVDKVIAVFYWGTYGLLHYVLDVYFDTLQ